MAYAKAESTHLRKALLVRDKEGKQRVSRLRRSGDFGVNPGVGFFFSSRFYLRLSSNMAIEQHQWYLSGKATYINIPARNGWLQSEDEF
jgi:hypothetical protein